MVNTVYKWSIPKLNISAVMAHAKAMLLEADLHRQSFCCVKEIQIKSQQGLFL